jgi:3-polyprenyl-4-hydroxybenzoate decarboxylase
MTKDLRSYLADISVSGADYLEVKNPLRRQECETTALLKHLDAARRYPAMIFTSVTNANGDESRFPLLSNVFATRERCARALGLAPDTPTGRSRKPTQRKRPEWCPGRGAAGAGAGRLDRLG